MRIALIINYLRRVRGFKIAIVFIGCQHEACPLVRMPKYSAFWPLIMINLFACDFYMTRSLITGSIKFGLSFICLRKGVALKTLLRILRSLAVLFSGFLFKIMHKFFCQQQFRGLIGPCVDLLLGSLSWSTPLVSALTLFAGVKCVLTFLISL